MGRLWPYRLCSSGTFGILWVQILRPNDTDLRFAVSKLSQPRSILVIYLPRLEPWGKGQQVLIRNREKAHIEANSDMEA